MSPYRDAAPDWETTREVASMHAASRRARVRRRLEAVTTIVVALGLLGATTTLSFGREPEPPIEAAAATPMPTPTPCEEYPDPSWSVLHVDATGSGEPVIPRVPPECTLRRARRVRLP